jgi:UDP-glucose 4-epimerase
MDNFRTGHRAAVPPQARLVTADLADVEQIDAVLAEGDWQAVFHFAALSQVGESMRMPMRYLLDNAANGIRLIDSCIRHSVTRFVLSSTAALFNEPGDAPIPEDGRIDPQSAYGDSKWMIERALHWAGQVHGLRYACLRYFNAAGADPAGRLGEDHRPESHLIPLVIDAALGRRPALEVYGDDYPTPDGTCIRDYIHVSDLAAAHVAALEWLIAHPGENLVLNCGYGRGLSVLEVLDAVDEAAGTPVNRIMEGRRAGDPPMLVAGNQRLLETLEWRPAHADIDRIVADALGWERRLMERQV